LAFAFTIFHNFDILPTIPTMDALSSFTYLADNLPSWNVKLNDLSKHVAERHAEFSKQSKSAIGPMAPKCSGSTESLRPDDGDQPSTSNPDMLGIMYGEPSVPTPHTPPLRVEINPSNRHIFRDIRNEKRQKRKLSSILSGASGPPRFRSRMSTIVYYDSCIQDDFQWLVRNIAGARNNLRKGKTAASFKSRMASLGMEESPFREGGISLRNPNIPRLAKSRNDPFNIDEFEPEAFDLVDKALEAAQTLCEVGAHQFLRDGSCYEELEGTKERFDTCLRIALEQVAILRAEAKAEVENLEAEPKPPLGSFDLTIDPVFQTETSAMAIDVAPTPPIPLSTGIIEIDQNDRGDDVLIDLSAFRSTRRGRNY